MAASTRQVVQDQVARADQGQYLTFMLGAEVFAIGILVIKEIIEYGQLTTVPMMPPSIRGVINLRGAVVPVIDLSARFGRKPAVLNRRTCIVIIEVHSDQERQVVGVIVDAVNEVLEIPAADIEPAPSFGTHIRTDFICGMGKIDNRFIVILDVDCVLSTADLAVAMAAGAGLEAASLQNAAPAQA